MRVSFPRHAIGAGLLRSRLARKSCHREIERAPEEMNRTALAEKRGAEFLENPVGINQDAAKAFNVCLIIRSVMLIFVMRRRIVEFCRLSVDLYFDSERSQCSHVFRVEIRHGSGVQLDDMPAA